MPTNINYLHVHLPMCFAPFVVERHPEGRKTSIQAESRNEESTRCPANSVTEVRLYCNYRVIHLVVIPSVINSDNTLGRSGNIHRMRLMVLAIIYRALLSKVVAIPANDTSPRNYDIIDPFHMFQRSNL